MASGWALAQVNDGYLRAPSESPQVAGFFGALEEINALADRSDGFIWRLADGDDATGIPVDDDPLRIINMSVWRDVEALHQFVYRTAHASVMAQRREWFAPHRRPHLALWWVCSDARPTVADGVAALDRLAADGPTPAAFTFKTRFTAPAT